MKIRIQSFSFLAALAVAVGMVSWGSVLHAQSTPSTPAPTQQQQQQPAPEPQQQTPAPTPDTTQQPPAPQAPPQTPDEAQSPSSKTASGATDSQVFTGTVVKQSDKYVLQDDAGHTYDIDHQDDVKKFEGKRVRVQGTLDPTGKKILVK